MGIRYLTAEEIKKEKGEVSKAMGKMAEFLVSGDVQRRIRPKAHNEAQLLDVGCSTGHLVEIAHKLGFAKENIHALDIDNYLHDQSFAKNLQIIDLNKESIPHSDEKFDVITSIFVMEHVENPFHFLRECARVLKKDGVFLLAVPNGNSWFDKLSFMMTGGMRAYRESNNHITFLLDPIFNKTALTLFSLEEMVYGKAFIPHLRPKRINGYLPRCRWLSYSKMYVLKKK